MMVAGQLEALIAEHGYQAVLNDLCVLMGKAITPNVIGYDVVWASAKDLSQVAYKLDRVRAGEAR